MTLSYVSELLERSAIYPAAAWAPSVVLSTKYQIFLAHLGKRWPRGPYILVKLSTQGYCITAAAAVVFVLLFPFLSRIVRVVYTVRWQIYLP